MTHSHPAYILNALEVS